MRLATFIKKNSRHQPEETEQEQQSNNLNKDTKVFSAPADLLFGTDDTSPFLINYFLTQFFVFILSVGIFPSIYLIKEILKNIIIIRYIT